MITAYGLVLLLVVGLGLIVGVLDPGHRPARPVRYVGRATVPYCGRHLPSTVHRRPWSAAIAHQRVIAGGAR